MHDVSTFRLYVLRAMYLLIVVGMGFTAWPFILSPPGISHMGTLVCSVEGALSLLAVLGIRYPLKMLPLLFFEFLWRSIWVLAFGLPLWSGQRLPLNERETLNACLIGVVLVPLVMPWGYVVTHYLMAPGDRWRRHPALSATRRATRGTL